MIRGMSNLDDNLKSYEEIQAYRKATESEFALTSTDPLAARQNTKDNLTLLGKEALEALATLIRTGGSENVRLRASQFVISSILDMDKNQDADDALSKLLTKLTS